MKIRTRIISGIIATTMAICTLATAAFAEEMFTSGEAEQYFEEPVYLPDDMFFSANPVIEEDLVVDDPADVIVFTPEEDNTSPADVADTDAICLAAPPETYIPSGNAKFYKRDGEYYMYSPDLGGELTVRVYTEIIKELYDSFGVEAAIEFAIMIDENPHDEEILRVFGPWEILDHWERRIDGKTNRWEI